MPKVKDWGIDTEEPDDIEPFDDYDGELPPKGVYICRIKILKLKLNKNDEKMLSIGAVISEPEDSPKSEYNGYLIWGNQNVTNQGKTFLKQFLNALGLTWKDFLSKTVTAESNEFPTDVLSIGKMKFPAHDSGNMPWVRCKGKRDRYEGEQTLKAGEWLAYVDEGDEEEDDDGEDAPF